MSRVAAASRGELPEGVRTGTSRKPCPLSRLAARVASVLLPGAADALDHGEGHVALPQGREESLTLAAPADVAFPQANDAVAQEERLAPRPLVRLLRGRVVEQGGRSHGTVDLRHRESCVLERVLALAVLTAPPDHVPCVGRG